MPRKLSLQHKFLLVLLAAIVSTFLLFVFVVSTLLTPQVAQRLVRLEEENRLHRVADTLAGDKDRDLEKAFESLAPPQTSLEAESPSDLPAVRIRGTKKYLVSHRPLTLTEANKVVRAPHHRQIVALLTGILVLYFLTWLLARFVNKPLYEVIGAVRALAKGERRVAVPIPPERELAELAESFNQMSESLAAREEQLREALEAKDLIFATTSHELRTPLTAILGYCQMLQDGLKGQLSEPQSQAVEVVERNARGLLVQVEAILTLSQLRQGSLPFQREAVDLRDLAQQAFESVLPLAEEKGLELSIELPQKPLVIRVDYQRGAQIAANLLGNALKYTADGKVEVFLSSEDGAACFRVADTGPGVPESFQQELFSEFSRGPGTEGIPGTGLGLAISKKLAQSMDGDVILVGSHEKGAEFLWTHPLAQTEKSS